MNSICGIITDVKKKQQKNAIMVLRLTTHSDDMPVIIIHSVNWR